MNNLIAYMTNTKTNETTRYSNFTFDHVLKFKGLYYGFKSDGIYLLTGADDDGTQIDASFRTNKSSFGSLLLKRVPYVFLDADTDTILMPSVDDIDYPEYTAGYDAKRTKLGRGIKGRYWSFAMRNVLGAPLRVKALEIELEVMTRKIS